MEQFEAPLSGITERKNSFFKDAEYFLYFRKGEFDNIPEVLTFFLDFLKANPELVIFASWTALTTWISKHYPQLKEMAKDTIGSIQKLRHERKIKKQLVIRIISTENKRCARALTKLNHSISFDYPRENNSNKFAWRERTGFAVR